MGRLEVAVGLVQQHRRRHAEHRIELRDAVACDPRIFGREPGPHLPGRRDRAVDAAAEDHGAARIGGQHFAQRRRVQARVLARQPPVGLAEGGAEGEAGVDDRLPLPDMVDLARQAQALGLAEQVAMRPESVDGEAELRLVAHSEAEGTRQAVGEIDIDRQLPVRIERGGGLDAYRVEDTERREPAAQQFDLGRIVGLSFAERNAKLQKRRVDLVGP